ncbi:Dedicator of cytokinesis protein 3 [Operophtera brumata]|uniref:Dedicator of cytokinesis protein 3 n=1 Tax=Operophtera brumata TaxID=104452 RepID=A0A0L7LRN1_OPEBR|nr:Dedicator of cytokinesis protein 3 [Operophtera brumata]
MFKLPTEDLLALLQWRARPEKVQETLLRVLRLGDGLSCEELIKFLRDVLDALFALLDESRFQHFRPVLDVYIEEHFSAALCLRSLGAVFRLAVRSRRLFARATGGQYEDSFRRDVALMTSWASVAKEVSSALGPVEAARVALMTSWASVAKEVSSALGPVEAARARNIVLTTACHHLRVHLARRDELAQCAEMLGELVTLLWKKEDPDQEIDPDELDPDVDVLCLNTLDVLVETRLWSHLAPHPHDRKPLKDFLMRAFLLWSGYMELGVALVTSSALQPERWAGRGPDRPRMRAAAGMQVLSTWNMLGPAQLHMLPGAVGALLEITLVSSLRRPALAALVALMAAERAATGSARRTEAALVDKLDSLVAENKADEHYRRWREAGAAFVGCVTRLLERLLDYRAVMQGAEHRDKRMAATVNLLNFYKNEIDRKEMYLRYVYKLHDLHMASDNFVEAGCTLLVGVDPEYPETPEWKRKEAIYNQVLQYFDRGKCWEKGLPLLRELATLYEVKLCDYASWAHCLRTHATFLDSVMEQLRPEPEYFRAIKAEDHRKFNSLPTMLLFPNTPTQMYLALLHLGILHYDKGGKTNFFDL